MLLRERVVIDELNLLRLEVLAQIWFLAQFDHDFKPIMPILLTGQNNLLDKFMYHTSRPIASRVVARSHLEGLDPTQMAGHLKHHQEIAGVKNQLFADEAILAIHQGSGGQITWLEELSSPQQEKSAAWYLLNMCVSHLQRSSDPAKRIYEIL